MIDKVKHLMEFNNMNQKDLAKAIKSTPVAVSRYLSGNRKPTIEFAVKIAKVFNVSLDWLLNEENK